jgi:hypothetical protein
VKRLPVVLFVVLLSLTFFAGRSCVVAQDLPEKDGDRVLFNDGTGFEDVETSEEDLTTNDASSHGMFEVTAEIGTQKVLGNSIPLTITIDPRIDSNKAEVLWDVPRGLETEDETDRWFTMVENSTRSFSINVVPTELGRYVVVVDVTAWRYDTNYVGSAEFEFRIDDQLHITPAQSEYVKNRTYLTVGTVLGIAVAGALLVLGAKFGLRTYRKWMAAD